MFKHKQFLVIIPIGLFILSMACTHKAALVNNNVDPTHNVDSTPVETVDTSVCFERDVLPIFTNYCAMNGCHSAASRQDGYILDNYTDIVAKGVKPGNGAGSKLYTVCANRSMPETPIAKLDSTQLSFIKRWIDMGAHNDTGCAVNCDTTKYTYATGIVPILHYYCYSCHSTSAAATAGGGTVLDTYSGVLAQAQNGKLLGDIQHSAGFNAMPLGSAKLTDCKITQVRKWIAAGSQNN